MDTEDHLRSPTLHFYNVGIWDKDMVNDKGWKLKKLSTIINDLNHNNVRIVYRLAELQVSLLELGM